MIERKLDDMTRVSWEDRTVKYVMFSNELQFANKMKRQTNLQEGHEQGSTVSCHNNADPRRAVTLVFCATNKRQGRFSGFEERSVR